MEISFSTSIPTAREVKPSFTIDTSSGIKCFSALVDYMSPHSSDLSDGETLPNRVSPKPKNSEWTTIGRSRRLRLRRHSSKPSHSHISFATYTLLLPNILLWKVPPLQLNLQDRFSCFPRSRFCSCFIKTYIGRCAFGHSGDPSSILTACTQQPSVGKSNPAEATTSVAPTGIPHDHFFGEHPSRGC